MITEQFGVVFYILPILLALKCQGVGWIAIVIGTLPAVFICGRNNQSPFSFFPFQVIMAGIAGWSLWEATRMASKYLMPGNSFGLTLVLGGLVVLLGIFTRQKGVRNVMNLMMVFILIPLLLVLIGNISGIDWTVFRESECGREKEIAYGAALTFSSMLFATFIPEESRRSKGKRYLAIGCSAVLLLMEYFVLVGNLGPQLLMDMEDPVMVLSGMDSGFWGTGLRLELLMAGSVYLWFMLLTISLASAIEGPGRKELSRGRKIFLGLAICGIALVCERNSYWLMAHRDRLLLIIGIAWILTRFFFFLLQRIHKKAGRKTAVLSLLLIMTMTMTGCSREIEDKVFINTVIVTEDQIFLISPSLSKSTGEEKSQSEDTNAIVIPVSEWKGIHQVTGQFTNKEIEVSHLEALILEKDLLKDDDFCAQLCESIGEDTSISWNTCLFTTTMSKPQKLNNLDAVEGNLGEYLVQVMDQSGLEKVTFTDFMKNQKEKKKQLHVPGVSLKEKIPRILIE